MRRLLGTLFLLLALSDPCNGQGSPPSDAPSSRAAECRVSDVGTALPTWSECRLPVSSTLVSGLCGAQSDQTAGQTFRRTRDRLAAKVKDFGELCDLDTALVQAQHVCSFTSHPSGSDSIASLMESVALNWHWQGRWERADQVYRRAFELYGAKEWQWPAIRVRLLGTWSLMKMEAGDPVSAIALARLRATLARGRYDHPNYADVESGDPKPLAASDLIRSLQTEALILEHANKADEARIAQQEADALQALYPPCQEDLCVETVIGKPISQPPNPCDTSGR